MTSDSIPSLTISMEGAGALLADAAGPVFSDACQQRIWALADRLREEPGVEEAVPGMNNLMVVFDPLRLDPASLEAIVARRWKEPVTGRAEGRLIEVPVSYGGSAGEDLLAFSAAKGLTPEEVVARHTAPIYGVAAVGAMPGFVYLSGLDPALSMPRRAQPRMAVPKGAVIVGGSQAGIMPVTAPSGWHILGHTALSLFDPLAEPPAAFRPGDRIRFVAREILR